MGMTIDEAIDFLVESKYSYESPSSDTLDVAISTMRKYQKIQAIAEKCNLKLLPKEAMSTFMKDILEVIEDE